MIPFSVLVESKGRTIEEKKIKRHTNRAVCENGILTADMGNGFFIPCSCLPCCFLRIWSRVLKVEKALQASFWLSLQNYTPGSLAELLSHQGRKTPRRNHSSLPASPVLRRPFVPKQHRWFSSAIPHTKSQVFNAFRKALVYEYNKMVAVLATWKCQCHTKHEISHQPVTGLLIYWQEPLP